MEFTLLADAAERPAVPVLMDNGEIRQLNELLAATPLQTLICGGRPDALRGARYGKAESGKLEYLGVAPNTLALLATMDEHYTAANSWNCDFPDPRIELRDDVPARIAAISERLTREFADGGYELRIHRLAPRHLWYFSDGNQTTQRNFLTMSAFPATSPYRLDGELRSMYAHEYTPLMRDSQVPMAPALKKHTLRPLLYRGAAFAFEFDINGVDPAFGGCRVYLDWDGNFICSDWCQRTGKSTYSAGVDLQVGYYTTLSWVAGPAIQRCLTNGHMSSKALAALKKHEAKRYGVKELLASAPPPVPTFEQAAEAARTALNAQREAGKNRYDLAVERFASAIDRSIVQSGGWKDKTDDALALAISGTAAAAVVMDATFDGTAAGFSVEGYPVLVKTSPKDSTEVVWEQARMIAQGIKSSGINATGAPIAICMPGDSASRFVTRRSVKPDRATLQALITEATAPVRKAATSAAPITPDEMAAVDTWIADYYASRKFALRTQRVQFAIQSLTPKPKNLETVIDGTPITFIGQDDGSVMLDVCSMTIYLRPSASNSSEYEFSAKPFSEGAAVCPSTLDGFGVLGKHWYDQQGVGV